MTRLASDLAVGQWVYLTKEEDDPALSWGGGFFGPSISTVRRAYEIAEHRYDPKRRLVTLTLRESEDDTCIIFHFGADARIEVKK